MLLTQRKALHSSSIPVYLQHFLYLRIIKKYIHIKVTMIKLYVMYFDSGLYTSGRESPVSLHSDVQKFPRRVGQTSDTESGHRRKYGKISFIMEPLNNASVKF